MSEAKFREAYELALRAACTEHPDEYAYPADEAPAVVDKMLRAIHENKFNHAGRALRATCKALGIKHTQTAIKAFVIPEGAVLSVRDGVQRMEVPLVQGTFHSSRNTILTVAQDATREELDAVMRNNGVDPAGYWERSVDSTAQRVWLKSQGLTLLCGRPRT